MNETKRDWQSRTIIVAYVGLVTQALVQFFGPQWQILRDNQEALVLTVAGGTALLVHLFRRRAKKEIGK